MARRDFRQVAALAYDRMGAFELGIVSEVFGLSRPELDVDWYPLLRFLARPASAARHRRPPGRGQKQQLKQKRKKSAKG